MAKLLLIAPNLGDGSAGDWAAPPMGLWRIASFVRAHGHVAEVWDETLGAPLPEGPWDFVGFSVLHDTLCRDIDLMGTVKAQWPSATLVAGGIEATLNYEQLFDLVPSLDWVILGEGEHPMLDLLEGREPQGAVHRTLAFMTIERFRAYCFGVDYRSVPFDSYWALSRKDTKASEDEVCTIRVSTSTHCPRGCPFCSATEYHRVAAGRPVSRLALSAEDSIAVVRRIQEHVPGVRTIYFNDDSFCFDRRRAWTFFQGAPKLRYLIEAHALELDEELLQHMDSHGCRQVSIGVENCDPAVQRVLKKTGVTAERIEAILGWCKPLQIRPYLLAILFAPGLTKEGLVLNYRTLAGWVESGVGLSIMSYVRPYHGTEFFHHPQVEWQEKHGMGVTCLQPKWLVPDDPEVARVFREFHERLPARLAGMEHPFKGNTSHEMVALLGDLLRTRQWA